MSYFWDVVRFVYRWFFRYPVIGGVIAVLIWIVTFDGLAALGMPDLFWRISRLHSFFAGAGIALVFHIGPYVAFLIDSEEFVALGLPRFRGQVVSCVRYGGLTFKLHG
jgi:hypothetical protein